MSDEGEDSPPPRPRQKVKKIMLASSSSSSESDDSGPATSTRKKRLRVLSYVDSESSGSSVVLGRRRKRALPKLRDSDGDSDTSGWATDHSDAPKDRQPSNNLTSQAPKPVSGFASDSSEGNSDKCSICLMRFTDQQVGIPQSCEHIFCLDCITEWSRNINTCPVDRMTFDFIVVRACAGGRILSTQPVKVVERESSVELLFVEDLTSCQICGSATNEDTMLLCDGCDDGFHMECLTPPLTQIPINRWLCPTCVDRSEESDGSDVMLIADISENVSSVSSRRRRSSRFGTRSSTAEPSTSTGGSFRAADLPSTSREHSRASRAASRGNVESTRGTIRRKYKRRSMQTVIIQYDGRRRVKRKVKKRKTKKRQPRTAARRSHVRSSVRAKLACQRSERRAAAARASAAFGAALRELAGGRARAGLAPLALLGGNDLDYFSDEPAGPAGPARGGVAVRAAPAAPAAYGAYRQARRKMVALPPPTPVSDVLSSILESQALLHSKRSTVSVTVNGEIEIERKTEPAKPSRRASSGAASSSDGRPNVSQGADGAARQAPYPGARGGGGWGGGYRYPREQGGPRGGHDNGYAPPPRAPHHAPARYSLGDGYNGYEERRPYRYSYGDAPPYERNRRPPDSNRRASAGQGARRGGGPAWRPPRPPEDPLDMRTARAPAAAEKPPPFAPLPEPPVFPFAAHADAEEDERSDSSLVIDTDKYDPTEPTNDDEDAPAPSPSPLPPPPAPSASLAAVENILAGLDSAATVSADVLDSAVRHVLRTHLRDAPAPDDRSDEGSDGDCPNFSIYSATSVHIASDASAEARAHPAPRPAPPEGLEDLVQGDGDASPAGPLPSPPPAPFSDLDKRKSDEYNEKVSKRCPITTNTRNPIKIKLNTPSLIRRQVSLYDEEDAEEAEAPVDEAAETATAPPPPPQNRKKTPDLELDEEPRIEVSEERERDPSEERERDLNEECERDQSEERERDLSEESNRDLNEERERNLSEENKRNESEEREREPSEECERDRSETAGTPSIPTSSPPLHEDSTAAGPPDTPELDHRSELAPDGDRLEKMTESISETEDERSYTPCLDEHRDDPERGIEGLDTELISEDEGNGLFSEEERPSPPARAASPPAPAASPPTPEPDDSKKKKKKDSKKEGKERKGKSKRGEVAFKKAGKGGKERNYRTRDSDDSEEKRRDSGDSERARRRKEKRKDLERYDVRTLVSERRRRTKDAFGRDVSPRASPSPSPPRRASPSPRRARASPSPAARRSASPRRRRRRSASRTKREPRKRRSGSRARKRRRSVSPAPKPKLKKKKRSRSERPRSRSPRRKSPKRKRVRRRSGSRRSEAAAAAAAPWSPRPASPRTPPPHPAPPPPALDARRLRKRRDRSKHRRTDATGPSKEVFTSGDNILVSVSFKEQENGEALSRRERRRERRRRRRLAATDEAPPKPVAIIDLERSPFRELTPSPKNVIVLSDDEAGERAAPAPAPAAPAPAPAGPKTPPSPGAAAGEEPRGPNTPPEPPDSPDAYDPYEPTASPSPPSPAPAGSPPRPSMTLEAAQKTNMSADEVLDRRPLSPIEKVMALLQSTRDAPPDPPPDAAPAPAPAPAPAAPAPAPAAAPSPAAAPAPRVVLPEPARAAAPKLFLAKPSPIKSDPIKPMQQATKISRLPLPHVRRSPGGESPYSPGSSDFGDLFEPPAGAKRDSFDALFDKPPRRKRTKGTKLKKKGKTQVDVKIDDDNLKILDDLPSSAVEMQVKSKFLKKLNRQERVVEEVKLVLKPHYNKKHVSKEEYKHILRRTVPKICHNKTGEINPTKIQALVEAYVKKFRKKHKLGLA